ncbi:MAG TPA: MarR family transcriptional regulator [Gaiellaceae bacterium]|nr:MarR family transcriptional regulator [Gaiellaceae bacterium]
MAKESAMLAAQLSRSWRELGSVLASRRLLASIGNPADARLTPTKLRALDLIAEHGGVRIGDLAAGVFVDETTATRLVDRLEAMGVAVRVPVPGDRRGTEVVLTAEGERLAADMAERRQEFFREVLEALDPEERAELVRLSVKATASLRERAHEAVGG